MAKKKRPPRGPGRARVLREVRSPGAEFARLRGEFAAWLVAHGLPASIDARALAEDAAVLVDRATATGLADLHRWTPDQVERLADTTDTTDAGTLTALPLMLAFLADTGRWAGTQQEFDAALAAAEDAASPVAEIVAELDAVAVDPQLEDAALRGLPVVSRAEALLRFVHPRRRVTGTGALGRADVVAVLDLFGIDLAGHAPRSLWDVPPLADLWSTLVEAELLSISRSNASTSPLAHGWLSGEPRATAAAHRRVAEAHLLGLLGSGPELPFLPDPVDTLLPALAGAALDRPMATAQVLPGSAAGTPDLGTATVRGLLDELADEGFVQVGDTVSAPLGLRGVLARCTAEVLGSELGDDGPPPPDPELAGQAWLLRVDLADADPPVWREVLVDPNTTLDQLHEVLQVLFEWEDSHLHDFVAVDSRRRTVRFAPPDPDGFGWGRPAEDESTVRLSSLTTPGAGGFVYRYDFGDSWEHLVTVRESRPAGGPLPRCTGGAGASPEEDSGGVWGWSEKLRAAADPAHPEHEDVRDWLGLADGEALDPLAFDLAATDRRLAVLRA